jgi:hypothetical protein
MDQPPVDRLLAALFPPPPEDGSPAPEVYAVLDGARDSRIYRTVYNSRLEHECLFTGEIPYDLAEAAPYLVRLTREAAFTRWVLDEGWGRSFGIFAWSRADGETLRRHFRRLLRVKDEQGRALYFRYYDPRVLRAVLPTWGLGRRAPSGDPEPHRSASTAEEQREVFGPVGRLLMEGDDGRVLSFAPGGRPTEARAPGRIPYGAGALVLREPQMAALRAAQRSLFVARLADRLRDDPELGPRYDEVERRRLAEEGMQHAEAMGLFTAALIERLVRCLGRRGPGSLTSEPGARAILLSPYLTPEKKLEQLEGGP